MPHDSEVTLLADLSFFDPVDAAVLDALARVTEATRREQGCLDYAAHVRPEDPRRVLFYERWTDQGALDRHWASDHLAAFREAVGHRLASAPALSFWRRLD